MSGEENVSTFTKDVTEFYRVYNPAKASEVPTILADAAAKGIKDDDVFASLCRKYSVKQFENLEALRKKIADLVPEAPQSEIDSAIRTAELRGYSEVDARRTVERKYKKVNRNSTTTSPVPQGAAPAAVKPEPSKVESRSLGLSKTVAKSKVDEIIAEEVREWLITALGEDCDQAVKDEPNMVDSLRNGVMLQVLLQKLRNPSIASSDIKRPKSNGFHARDSVSRFVKGIQSDFGIRPEITFDDTDLCDGKNDRAVVSCLLTLSRITYQRGVTQAPTVVKYEEEIEKAQADLKEDDVEAAIREVEDASEEESEEDGDADTAPSTPVEQEEPAPVEEQKPEPSPKKEPEEAPKEEEAPAAEEPKHSENAEEEKEPEPESPKAKEEVVVVAPAEELPPKVEEASPDPERELIVLAPKKKKVMKAKKGDQVDEHVCAAFYNALQKNSKSQTRLTRLKNQGEYIVYHRITGKRTVVYVRMVQKNLMIRVGGGWDDFEGWLARHMVDCETAPAGTAQRLNQQEALGKKSKSLKL